MRVLIGLPLLFSAFAFGDGYETFAVGQVMVRGSGMIEVSKISGTFAAATGAPDRAYVGSPLITDPDTRKMILSTLYTARAAGANVQCYIANINGSNYIRDASILPDGQ